MREVISALHEWQSRYEAVNSALWGLAPPPSISLLASVTDSLASATHALVMACEQTSLPVDTSPLHAYVARLQRLCRVARLDVEETAQETKGLDSEALIKAGNRATAAILAIMAVASRPWDERRVQEVDAEELRNLKRAVERMDRQVMTNSQGSIKKQLQMKRNARLCELAQNHGLFSPAKLLKVAMSDPQILSCTECHGVKLTKDVCRNVLKPRGTSVKKIPRQPTPAKKSGIRRIR